MVKWSKIGTFMTRLCHLQKYLLLFIMPLIAGMGAVLAGDVSIPPLERLHGPSLEVQEYQQSPKVEVYRLRIVNDANGEIATSTDQGVTWSVIGHVVGYTEKVSDQGYTASKWSPLSAIAATAVNAIHIRTGYNAKDDKGVVFSLLPKEMLTEAGKKLQSFYSQDASIYTDIAGGSGIFGGQWAPVLGNAVALNHQGTLVPLPENYTPHKGDIFVICVLRPLDSPKAIVFENRFGGLITIVGWDDSTKLIGQVLKPVEGVGRFWGAEYTGLGRLRANHNGVIDISASPLNAVGGIQILPRDHAMSPEMTRARTMTQWMVVGPLDARDPSWEGVAPLFRDYLYPNWTPDDLTAADWKERLLAHILIEVRLQNGPWQPIPSFVLDPDVNKPLPEWANTALQEMTHLRILLPPLRNAHK